jgi:hypothetical protein
MNTPPTLADIVSSQPMTVSKTRLRMRYKARYPRSISTKLLTISYGVPLGLFLMGTIYFLAGFGITPVAVVVIPACLIWAAILLAARALYRRKFRNQHGHETDEIIFL